jgi:hypothetical protein
MARLEDSGPSHSPADRQRLVRLMATHMGRKLEANAGKRSWLDASVTDGYLVQRLIEELQELMAADPGDCWGEAADVANLAGMLADRKEQGDA